MASDPGGAVSDLFGAFGSLQAASAYGKASKLAANNAAITRASTAITQQQEARTITQALGAEDAAVAGAGLQQSGTALDLMRSSVQQSSLAKQLITNQGEITATSYDQQSAAYKAQEKGANTQAMGQGIGGVLKMVGWIICTELVRQGRMPKRWYVGGAAVFAAYPEAVKQGYYLWAIPSVRHLRKFPNSAYSRFLCTIFNWRIENIAAHRGFRARKLLRGAIVTAILWPLCYALGSVMIAAGKTADWKGVYSG
jgi:hypothetical protein